MIELFEFGLSGNCHKVRIMLSLLGLEYRSHLVNGGEREHKSPEFLTMNPFGQVPVLKDGDTVIRDSQAILVYLARKYGAPEWFPMEPALAAEVTAWLAVAANEVARGPNALRLHHKFGRAINLQDAEKVTESLLKLLNQHLEHRDWLATATITVADVAMYPYIALAREGKVDLAPYLHVENWMGRLEMLTGYVSMPGIQLRAI